MLVAWPVSLISGGLHTCRALDFHWDDWSFGCCMPNATICLGRDACTRFKLPGKHVSKRLGRRCLAAPARTARKSKKSAISSTAIACTPLGQNLDACGELDCFFVLAGASIYFSNTDQRACRESRRALKPSGRFRTLATAVRARVWRDLGLWRPPASVRGRFSPLGGWRRKTIFTAVAPPSSSRQLEA